MTLENAHCSQQFWWNKQNFWHIKWQDYIYSKNKLSFDLTQYKFCQKKVKKGQFAIFYIFSPKIDIKVTLR